MAGCSSTSPASASTRGSRTASRRTVSCAAASRATWRSRCASWSRYPAGSADHHDSRASTDSARRADRRDCERAAVRQRRAHRAARAPRRWQARCRRRRPAVAVAHALELPLVFTGRSIGWAGCDGVRLIGGDHLAAASACITSMANRLRGRFEVARARSGHGRCG